MQIKNIQIKNLKSLKDINITLSNLTLVTGVNSSGKSSFIQSILLLKQNQEKFYSHRGSKIVNINGKYVKLGNKKDILFEDILFEEVVAKNIKINTENKELRGNITSPTTLDNSNNLQHTEVKENIKIKISNIQKKHSLEFDTDKLKIKDIKILPEDDKNLFNIFYDDFQYIATDRIAPSISYQISEEEIDKNLIGITGEYTAHYLANNRHKSILEELRYKESKTDQLLENVSLWLSEISSNIEVKAKVYDELQMVNLTYSYTYGYKKTKDYTPLNVGFGVTYVLPIIVAILKAKKGDLLIIENPESHLHPAGQSKIAELCAIASANGVQIIVETHSDHFLNGIRVATKKGLLTPEQSKIYYFRKDKDELETKIDELNIDSEGRINESWPKGFFDEYRNQLDELLW